VVASAKYLNVGAARQRRAHANEYVSRADLRHVDLFNLEVFFAV
jgi:hypothetical protein